MIRTKLNVFQRFGVKAARIAVQCYATTRDVRVRGLCAACRHQRPAHDPAAVTVGREQVHDHAPKPHDCTTVVHTARPLLFT